LKFQHTLARPVCIEGIGLHSGQSCRLTLRPALPDSGINLVCNGCLIPARAQYVVSTQRAVTLGRDGQQVQTVEHLLASLAGLEIDNATIEVEGMEIPALDGSAAGFVAALRQAGRKHQEAPQKTVVIDTPVWVYEENSMLLALPANSYKLTYIGGFPGVIGSEIDWRLTPAIFADRLAPARTTVFHKEVEALLAAGLGRGGAIENVVVLDENGATTPLRFEDEPLRHKMLDLVGDLSLVGARLAAHVIAIRSGHSLNVALAKKLISFQIGH
jgi:UDP-3-O-acyl N-acetylglucosamine deacetylase